MHNSDQIAKARRRATEQIDSAFTAINDGQTESAISWYVKALENIGRAKMYKENLGDEIADAPSESIILVDGNRLSAKDARLRVAVHYLGEHGLKCPIQFEDKSYEKLKPDLGSGALKSAIVGLKSLSAFL